MLHSVRCRLFALMNLNKHHNMKKIISVLCAACALILTFACSEKEDPTALEVSPSELNWEWGNTAAQTVTVTANYEWTARVSDESKWTLTPTNDGKTFSIAPKAENRTSNALTATSTVTCKELMKTITCTQAGGDFIDGYEFVDLGLTVDWASWNVGAQSSSDCGQYFAWGEASEKNDYTWDTYKWGTYNSSDKTNYGMTRYNKTDGLTTLQAGDDPATAAWGSKWRTPTRKEVKDLLDETNCEWKWTTKNGVEGYLVTSKVAGFEGKSIFLPLTGYRRNSSLKDETTGYYWSSSVDAAKACNAFYFYFSSSGHQGIHDTRNDGLSVRAVANPHPERDVTGGVEAVDLGLSVKWASGNVGAKSETDYGQYFAWGETAEKTNYDWSNSGEYKWGIYDSSDKTDYGMTKYNTKDYLTTLEAGDDPATAAWGSKWRTPTRN